MYLFLANINQSKFVVQPLMMSTIQTKASCLQYKQKQSVLIQSYKYAPTPCFSFPGKQRKLKLKGAFFLFETKGNKHTVY